MSSVCRHTVLSLPARLAHGEDTLHPVLLRDGERALLIDAGLPGMEGALQAALADAGVPPSRLTHVLLTHSDIDHMGGLGGLLRLCPAPVSVLCHALERPYVECEEPPLRLSQMEAGLNTLTGESLARMTELAARLRANYRNLRVRVTATAVDGEALPCGAEAVFTPGHTPGHLCLYLRESKTLVAGDALAVRGGRLCPTPGVQPMDGAAAAASLQKLTGYDIQTVVCYHGGVFEDNNVNEKIRILAGPTPQPPPRPR